MEADYTLHFLRPWWLLALLPAAWFIWKLWHQAGKQGAWNQVIASQFKPILLGEKSEEQAIPWPIMGLRVTLVFKHHCPIRTQLETNRCPR